MVTAGIVAEYNPFHNGHKYQIERTRAAGATHIVAVMSGSSVQRGDTAVYSKYERAAAAVENGVDLVIELPCPYSCSNGEVFSSAAVRLLAGLGEDVVNMISFGCENDSIDSLLKTADTCDRLMEDEAVKRLIREGYSYPQALSMAAGEISAEAAEILSTPNNLLGVEYIRAARATAPWISFNPVKRVGSGHDSEDLSEGIASASAVRKIIDCGGCANDLVPYNYRSAPAFMKNMDSTVMYRIMTVDHDELLSLPDVNENIANRFEAVRRDFCGDSAGFMLALKSRNITLARVRRLILHLVLGVRSEDICPVPYGRILALNVRGREILAKAQNRLLPYDTSLKRLEDTSEFAKRISRLERNSVYFQDLCREKQEKNTMFTNEYRQKIQIIFKEV